MSLLFTSLLWTGAACVYVAWWRKAASMAPAFVGWALAATGLVGTIFLANGFFAGVAEATAHFLGAASAMAVFVPLAAAGEVKSRRAAKPPKPREPMHGVGRITAAVIGAPAAATLVVLAAPKLIPLSSDMRYLVAVLAVVPAMTIAPYFALSARSAKRAWGFSGLVSAVALLVIWSALP